MGAQEVTFNGTSRVVAFQKWYTDETDQLQPARINYYYTTGTVGTALNHPRQGRTQMFRRDVSLAELEQIFANPPVRTGRGCQRRANMPASSAHSATQESILQMFEMVMPGVGEERAPVSELQALEEEQRQLTRGLCRERHRWAVMLDRIRALKDIGRRQQQAHQHYSDSSTGPSSAADPGELPPRQAPALLYV